MLSITRRFTFEACHHLPEYDGVCSRPHGHSYKLSVTVSSISPSLVKTGMIMDFKELKKIVKTVIVDVYDHQDLNAFFLIPTAEMMVSHFFLVLAPVFAEKGITLNSVRLWETEDCYAEVSI